MTVYFKIYCKINCTKVNSQTIRVPIILRSLISDLWVCQPSVKLRIQRFQSKLLRIKNSPLYGSNLRSTQTYIIYLHYRRVVEWLPMNEDPLTRACIQIPYQKILKDIYKDGVETLLKENKTSSIKRSYYYLSAKFL